MPCSCRAATPSPTRHKQTRQTRRLGANRHGKHLDSAQTGAEITPSCHLTTRRQVSSPRIRSTIRSAAWPSCQGLNALVEGRDAVGPARREGRHVAHLRHDLVGRAHQRPRRGVGEGEQEAADAAGVVVEVGHEEDHRPPGQGVVEAQRGVVEHGDVGGQHQVVDLGVVGHVDDPAPRRPGRVEAVAAQQDHVGVAEGRGGRVDVEVLGHRRRARTRGEVVAPGGGVEHGRLVRRDAEPTPGLEPGPVGVGSAQRVVAGVAVLGGRTVVAVLLPVDRRHLRGRGRDQVPRLDAASPHHGDPARRQLAGAPLRLPHRLRRVAVEALDDELVGPPAVPLLELGVGDQDPGRAQHVVPRAGADHDRRRALRASTDRGRGSPRRRAAPGARRCSSSKTARGVSVAERPAKLSKYQRSGSVGRGSTAYDARSCSWP